LHAAQLNCAVDAGAKQELVTAIADDQAVQQTFPLEPITCFAGCHKLTPDGKRFTKFWIQKKLARTALSDMKVLTFAQFDEVAWKYVLSALETVPRMFQVWACKQVLDIANTNHTVHRWDKGMDPRCPSCLQSKEMTEHILLCNEAGRVDIFLRTVCLLEWWLRKMATDPVLRECIVQFCHRRGFLRMRQIFPDHPAFQRMARSQDGIGWQRFMEGMISRRLVDIQRDYFALRNASWKLDRWAMGLVVRLLEITHGQWLYWNVVVHDATSGRLAVARKDEIAEKIEEELAAGGLGLLEDDWYLLEVNLGDLSESTGEGQEYWLLVIQAARVSGQIAAGILPTDGTDYG
jgi:hypothetical protein